MFRIYLRVKPSEHRSPYAEMKKQVMGVVAKIFRTLQFTSMSSLSN